jgi:hypothetical protein
MTDMLLFQVARVIQLTEKNNLMKSLTSAVGNSTRTNQKNHQVKEFQLKKISMKSTKIKIDSAMLVKQGSLKISMKVLKEPTVLSSYQIQILIC